MITYFQTPEYFNIHKKLFLLIFIKIYKTHTTLVVSKHREIKFHTIQKAFQKYKIIIQTTIGLLNRDRCENDCAFF